MLHPYFGPFAASKPIPVSRSARRPRSCCDSTPMKATSSVASCARRSASSTCLTNCCRVLNRKFFWIFKDFAHFFAEDSTKFRKTHQSSEILSNFLAFREIPGKIYEICTEKMRNQMKIYEKFAKFLRNINENVTKFLKLVRRIANFLRFSWSILYSLKNAAKRAYSRYRSCPYSRERASESPENPRKKILFKTVKC